MNIIALLKQVPDITSIPIDAWNQETGTLKRSLLDNMLNPLDLHALSCAQMLRDSSGGGRVVCISMGISAAAEILLEAMARGADEGILLNDAAFAGADTSATARTLALAVRKVQRELFGDDEDYVVVAGMQSNDGDTAQVPAQVAEALGVDCVAYVAGLEYQDGPVLRRITGSGSEQVRLTRRPAVLTLTDCMEPPYPSLARSRMVRKLESPVTIWTARDLQADARTLGAKGSWTQVVRIFSPMQGGRKCRFAGDAAELVRLIEDSLHRQTGAAGTLSATADRKPANPAYTGGVFVYAERAGSGLAPVVHELIYEARGLAQTLGVKVGVVLAGDKLGDDPQKLIAAGADEVYAVSDERLIASDTAALCSAVADVVLKYRPQIMLFGATHHGRELAPRVAYATSSGLTADCTSLAIGDSGGREGILLQTRPALGGNIMATIISKSCRTQMATVRPGVFAHAAPDVSRKGLVIEHKCSIRQGGVKVVSVDPPLPKMDLAYAQVIVSGGAGMRNRGDFERLLQPLAEALAGGFSLRASVGASRRAVEHSYAAREVQVGQTGQTVSPVMYVAVGISGAVQHISAIQKSKVIVAINPDREAAIFRSADVGIVGKAEVVIPQLLEELRGRSHGK